MTSAPPSLLAVRSLLLGYLGQHGLTSAEVGIVGDSAHRGGYHCGSDRLDLDDYSVRESSRDRTGLTLAASAIDVGMFEARVAGKVHRLPDMSLWLVAQCKAGTPDTRDIREVIYSPDTVVVRRWDRLGIRSTGDGSHRWHTHISYHRDAIKAGRDQTGPLRRYLTEIGLLEGDDVSAAEVWDETKWVGSDGKTVYPASSWLRMANTYAARAMEQATAARSDVAALRAEVATLAGRDLVDEPAIVAGVLAGLDAETIAAAIPQTIAKQVADELGARLTTGTTGQ